MRCISLLFIPVLLLSCKQNKTTEAQNLTSPTKILDNKEVDKDFKTFIDIFSTDSLFQISRIKFPFKVKQYDTEKDNYDIVWIDSSTHYKMDFRQKQSTGNLDRWEQHFTINDNKTIIEISGIDNGIMIRYFFEKIDGKWFFIEIQDDST